jgi:hypothetical protein
MDQILSKTDVLSVPTNVAVLIRVSLVTVSFIAIENVLHPNK